MKTQKLLAFVIGSVQVIAHPNNQHHAALKNYTDAHSLGEGYKFTPHEGWEHANATNLPYKYGQDHKNRFHEHHGHSQGTHNRPGLTGITGILDGVKDTVFHLIWKAFGKPEKVKITWYTGKDLENPSCWAKANWTPTDDSFICALTMKGWTTKPKCFEFIELCNSPSRCVFLRVIDSCAGCEEGSKHVDMTKRAFKQVAPGLDTGIMTVQMRRATPPPDVWYEDLWGPKEHGT
ncbi:hypothetical protein BDN72DRAFT_831451 [Pluteus cervinus]|uniref:Uncharacterized protein n=1 Tax=Pluteus cervinus TaxID=181527 RepID=A0ACD3BDB4_9AGAR|nr:hypothetical protein BDN72DRAFT_831451 [Pluteus cervinus]